MCVLYWVDQAGSTGLCIYMTTLALRIECADVGHDRKPKVCHFGLRATYVAQKISGWFSAGAKEG